MSKLDFLLGLDLLQVPSQQVQVSIATAVLQAVVVVLPFLLAATRYVFQSDYWEDVEAGSASDILIPGFILIAYFLLYNSIKEARDFLTSSVIESANLTNAVDFLSLFVFAMFIVVVFPVIRSTKHEYVRAFLLVVWMAAIAVITLAGLV